MTITLRLTKLWQLIVLLAAVFLIGIAIGGKFAGPPKPAPTIQQEDA